MTEYERGRRDALSQAIAEFEQVAKEVERERHPTIAGSKEVLETVRACAEHLRKTRDK